VQITKKIKIGKSGIPIHLRYITLGSFTQFRTAEMPEVRLWRLTIFGIDIDMYYVFPKLDKMHLYMFLLY
jgi:hypothetical protein